MSYYFNMNKKIDTVVILAGGKGTRMREETEFIPKPMVKIGDKPLLMHLIDYFASFKNFNFVICTGYKEEIIFDYFAKHTVRNVKILSTGLETNTGGRIAQVKNLINSDFIMTYGDGLSDIKINNLIDFHLSHSKTATISVTKPFSRFGLVNFDSDGVVYEFIEKPKLNSYINMGYMVLNQNIFSYINENEIFEQRPLERLADDSDICAFKHEGFFKPLDTYREYLEFKKMWDTGKAPWKVE
jgi:glucose-1-phosphate cytidylyltransferase